MYGTSTPFLAKKNGTELNRKK